MTAQGQLKSISLVQKDRGIEIVFEKSQSQGEMQNRVGTKMTNPVLEATLVPQKAAMVTLKY